MSRRVATMITGGVLLLALVVITTQLPVPYVELGPGPTVNTLGEDGNGKDVIQIMGKSTRDTDGHLNLTTVSVKDHLDLLTALRGWVDRKRSVVPREEVFPSGQTEEEVQEQNTEQFTESQSSAESAALGELGYPLEEVVQEIPKSSPSTNKLAPGDVITSINGTAVRSNDAVTGVLKPLKPGTVVTVAFLRKNKQGVEVPGSVSITTTKSTQHSGAAMGVSLSEQRDAPFTVKIGLSEDIGGPSAGLMFALGIIEKVGPDDLTGGEFIAGTGTITRDGKVGTIGGIPLKMIAAREKGATVFLVPSGNCAEAVRNPPKGLRIVKVETLHDAVTSLKALQNGGSVPTCPTS